MSIGISGNRNAFIYIKPFNCLFVDEEKLYYIIGEFEIIWPGEMTYNERLTDLHEHLWNYIDTDNCVYNEGDARFYIYRKMHRILTFYSRMEFPTSKAEIRDFIKAKKSIQGPKIIGNKLLSWINYEAMKLPDPTP